MYLVVSQWEAFPGREEEFERVSPAVRAVLSQQPGVAFLEAFKGNGHFIVVHGYDDEAAYQAVINNTDGAFQQALAAHHLEDMGRWLSSERGETFPH